MSKAQLIEMAKHNIAHAKDGTIEQADNVVKVPSEDYYNEDRWQQEVDRIFKRVPLMLGMTCEIPNPGDYKSVEAAGVPVIISRDDEGGIQAFVNMCSHRGAQITPEGKGNTKRFVCPYHAWSYNTKGDLVGVYQKDLFGDIDRSCYGLTKLPVTERAGLIWVILNPKSTLDFDTFLAGYDGMLAHFGFDKWHHFASRVLKGPNWKIAYDGYLDLYHLPILHKNTFGADFPNKTLYYSWGPHQRVTSPDPSIVSMSDTPESQWPVNALLNGVWTIFPHISIASFDQGARGVLLSQLFPGATPDESFTIQNYVLEKEPTEEEAAGAKEQFDFLKYVVQEEDYATGIKQQIALQTGAKDHVLFGRNEGGGQNFHRWVSDIIATDDEDLNKLFAQKKMAAAE